MSPMPTFQIVASDGSVPCPSFEAAKRQAYAWTAWANRCALRNGDCLTSHRMTFDEPSRRITIECGGMTQTYTY